jgi:TolB-like protein
MLFSVLPFADLSPGSDQEYFSDGIAEEILNVLVRIEDLKVASRTTSWGFKGQEALGIPFMAEKMNVRHVLEGSVRKSGDTVRITAQLIDAETDQHLWSETYDRTLTAESVFEVQDDIAKSIVEQLGIIMDPGAVVAMSCTLKRGSCSLSVAACYALSTCSSRPLQPTPVSRAPGQGLPPPITSRRAGGFSIATTVRWRARPPNRPSG